MARTGAASVRSFRRTSGRLLRMALIAVALVLAGCTTGSRATADSFRLLLHKPVEVSPAAVAANRFPQVLVETRDLTAVAVLGYVDGGRQQWYAGTHAVIELDGNGVLLGSSGLGRQLQTRIIGASPFDRLTSLSGPAQVQRQYDWMSSYQLGVVVTGTLTPGATEEVRILGRTRTLQRFVEHLQGGGMDAQNIYWADPATGFIWKSRQHLAPGYVVELTQLKPYRAPKG